MKRIVLVCLLALTMISLFAANQTRLLANSNTASAGSSAAAQEAMRTADQLYEAGQYAQAAQAYQQVVDQGFVESALFYNLGNAQFKRGDLGQAILNYRRAQQVAPRDPDVAANLAVARGLRTDQVEAVGGGGLLTQIGSAVGGWFALDEVAMVALGGWILFIFSLILFGSLKNGSAWRRRMRTVLLVTTILFAAGVVTLGSAVYENRNDAAGVIVTAEVAVRSGPGAQYVTGFTLHSGAEVDLVEVQGNWVRLALPGTELEGWLPASAVEAVSTGSG